MRTYHAKPVPQPKAGQQWQDFARELTSWIDADSKRVERAAQADTGGLKFQILASAPAKTAEGEVIVADGSNYDPGQGKGAYIYQDAAYAKIGPFTAKLATLVGGTVTVSYTGTTANTLFFIARQTTGGTVGHLRIASRNAGADFTITSSSGTETSTVAWLAIEPTP